MNKSIFLPLALLAGCGSENFSDFQQATSDPCGTRYYQEIIGTYDGGLARGNAEFWTVFTVEGINYVGTCNMEFYLQTIATDPSLYADIDAGGNFMTQLDADGNQDFWNDPQFPVDAFGQFYSRSHQGDDTLISGRFDNGVDVFRVTFHGGGTVTFANTFGSLIKL